jgi:hypothetical protein
MNAGPMDMMVQGYSTSRFQTWQQWSTMLFWQRETRSRAGYPASIARCFPPAWSTAPRFEALRPQRDDVRRHLKPVRQVPSGLVEQQHGMRTQVPRPPRSRRGAASSRPSCIGTGRGPLPCLLWGRWRRRCRSVPCAAVSSMRLASSRTLSFIGGPGPSDQTDHLETV